MKKALSLLTIAAVSAITLVGFQNCGSQVDFVTDQASFGLSGPVICDPFSPGSTCKPGEGLKGPLFYLLADDSTSPRAKVNDIISNGEQAPAQIVFSKLDVDTRAWSDGFPGTEGLILNNDGNPLNEWFAFDLNGFIRLDTTRPTEIYQFAVFSDDGSILSINGNVLIDHDGQHSPAWKCATSPVTLIQGNLYDVNLKYFQGPRTQIALRLMWRPYSQNGQPCSSAGGFTPVPKEVLFH